MPVRIYIAPQIGSGIVLSPDPSTWSDTTGPFRSLLNNFINLAAGEGFEEIDHPARRISICTVEASATTLDAIEGDARVVPVLPIRATDRTHLESLGVNTEWITGASTMKDVLRQIVKLFSVAQVADGHGQTDVKEFIRGNLDVQVSAIPVAQRQAIGAWLQSRGIDTSWITGSTTVRQVVASLPENFAKLYGRNATHRFAGEDF